MKTTLLPALLLSGCSMTFYGLKETNEEPPKAPPRSIAACPAPPQPALAAAPIRPQRPGSTPTAQADTTGKDKTDRDKDKAAAAQTEQTEVAKSHP